MGIPQIIQLVIMIVRYAPELIGVIKQIAEAIKKAREGQLALAPA